MDLIAEGNYVVSHQVHPSVYAFERHYNGQSLLVLNNFYGETTNVSLGNFVNGKVLLSNYEVAILSETFTLYPYQTLAILLP